MAKVFSQEELEYIVFNTLANLMVVVDNLMGVSDVPLERVRESLLMNKEDLLQWQEAKTKEQSNESKAKKTH